MFSGVCVLCLFVVFLEIALFYQVILNLRMTIVQMGLGMKGMFTEMLGSCSIKLQPLEARSVFLIFPLRVNCKKHIRHIWTTC